MAPRRPKRSPRRPKRDFQLCSPRLSRMPLHSDAWHLLQVAQRLGPGPDAAMKRSPRLPAQIY
eukprot:2455547-Pyramimonas_sp.AAC.1